MFQHTLVPDVMGLPFALACRLADEAGLEVTGLGSDGRGVDADSEETVIAQDPPAGEKTKRGTRLTLHTGGRGGPAGDREPLEPLPLVHSGDSDLENSDPATLSDPDADPELAGVPA